MGLPEHVVRDRIDYLQRCVSKIGCEYKLPNIYRRDAFSEALVRLAKRLDRPEVLSIRYIYLTARSCVVDQGRLLRWGKERDLGEDLHYSIAPDLLEEVDSEYDLALVYQAAGVKLGRILKKIAEGQRLSRKERYYFKRRKEWLQERLVGLL